MNSMTFDLRKKTEREAYFKLLNYFADYNVAMEETYIEFRETQSDMFTTIEWTQCYYDESFNSGHFEYVDSDHKVMLEGAFPDNTIGDFYDEEDYKSQLEDWLKEHPNWKQNEFGRWYQEDEKSAK